MQGMGSTSEATGKPRTELAELRRRPAESGVAGTGCIRAGEALQVCDECFRSLVETMNDWVWELDANSVFTFASPRVKELLGYWPEEIIGRTPMDLMLPEEAGRVARRLQTHMASQEPITGLENSSLHKDGRLVVLESSGVPLFDADGRLCGYRGISRDITRRSLAEEALSVRDEKYWAIFDEARDGIVLIDAETGLITDCNPEFERLAGRAATELLKTHIWELRPPGQMEAAKETFFDAREMGLGESSELMLQRPDGEKIPVEFLATRVIVIRRRPYIQSTYRDITERKLAEQVLRQNEEQYRFLFENSRDLVSVSDLDGGVVIANSAWKQTLGYSPETHADHLEKVHADDRARVGRAFRRLIDGEADSIGLEYRCRAAGDEYRYLEATAQRMRLAGGAAMHMVAHDVTERKRTELELRAREEKYRAVFDGARDGIVLVDAEAGLIVDCNGEFERQTGRSVDELRALHIWDLVPSDQIHAARQKHAEIVEAGVGGSSEVAFLRPSGRTVQVEFTAQLIDIGGRPHTQAICRDVTERILLERQSRELQVLASLGGMTAGIAHEVNNPLAAILLYSEMIDPATLPPAAKKDLRVIRGEAKRASGIVKDLLAYSHGTAPESRKTDISKTLVKVLDMRRYQQRVRNVDLTVEMAKAPIRIIGKAAQLTQLFMNLVVNAEEALEESDDKRIAVIAEVDGDKVKISIADSGTGIPEELMTQVFAPFFTTKPIGKGTGLGLSACHGIAAAHGGWIRAENNDMGGATFVVEFPLAGKAK